MALLVGVVVIVSTATTLTTAPATVARALLLLLLALLPLQALLLLLRLRLLLLFVKTRLAPNPANAGSAIGVTLTLLPVTIPAELTLIPCDDECLAILIQVWITRRIGGDILHVLRHYHRVSEDLAIVRRLRDQEHQIDIVVEINVELLEALSVASDLRNSRRRGLVLGNMSLEDSLEFGIGLTERRDGERFSKCIPSRSRRGLVADELKKGWR